MASENEAENQNNFTLNPQTMEIVGTLQFQYHLPHQLSLQFNTLELRKLGIFQIEICELFCSYRSKQET